MGEPVKVFDAPCNVPGATPPPSPRPVKEDKPHDDESEGDSDATDPYVHNPFDDDVCVDYEDYAYATGNL